MWSPPSLEAVKKTKKFCGVSVDERALPSGIRVVWCQHDFGFIGGSLGCAEGAKLAPPAHACIQHALSS
jgi:acetyl-CoA carboxylase beta subunit